MSRKKLKLYLFSGRTVLVANKIKALQNKLPNAVDITRRTLLFQSIGQETFDPFVLDLNLEETKSFCEEVSLKVSQPLEVFVYLSSDWSQRGSNQNPAIVKIKLIR